MVVSGEKVRAAGPETSAGAAQTDLRGSNPVHLVERAAIDIPRIDARDTTGSHNFFRVSR
jgi:hypothetical protein